MSPLSRSLVVICVLVALAVQGRARADAIQPKPEECPLGTEPRTDHGGRASCRAVDTRETPSGAPLAAMVMAVLGARARSHARAREDAR